jgi:hypothetical protein
MVLPGRVFGAGGKRKGHCVAGGRKEKYADWVRPRLSKVMAWAADGLTEQAIAKKLGISYQTYCTYKRSHPELLDAVIRGREDAVADIKSSLYERATGKAKQTRRVVKDERTGSIIEETVLPPDPKAASLILAQWDKDYRNPNSLMTQDWRYLEMRLAAIKVEETLGVDVLAEGGGDGGA